MKFGYTIMYVPDVERALAFYEQAFGLARKMVAPGGEYGELNTGETTLGFAANSMASHFEFALHPNESSAAPPAIEVAFTTEDVPKAYAAAIAAGALPVAVPTSKPWGQIVAYVRDLNGVLVELCTPVG
jgi:catechol 2,3-dioxygenase-like lactoylglutathione lyase family enzyme